MSILIKGVRLPSNCLYCPMQFGGFCYVKPDWVEGGRVASTVDEAYKQGRPSWCPLEEVPETHEERTETHACDLIERQAVLNLFPTHDWKHLYDAVKNLPSADALDNEKKSDETLLKTDRNTVSNGDFISRQGAIATAISGRIRTLPTTEDGENWIRVSEVRESLLTLPSAQPELTEPTYEQVCLYCEKRCLSLIDNGLLKKYESAQPEQPEIIRCKDCKDFRRWIDTDITFCDLTEGRVCEDDFCSRAERRTDE